MELKAQDLINKLDLTAHPEGGYFKETYRSDGTIAASSVEAGMNGERNYSTAIYFLLDDKKPSKFHRIKSDEVWHFYLGSPIEIVELDENLNLQTTILGPELDKGHTLQHVVKKNRWFGAKLSKGNFDFSLVGCTVAPGFAFEDFEMASRETFKSRDLGAYANLCP